MGALGTRLGEARACPPRRSGAGTGRVRANRWRFVTDRDTWPVYLLPPGTPGLLGYNPQLSATPDPASRGAWGWASRPLRNPLKPREEGHTKAGHTGAGDRNLRQCHRCPELRGGPAARGDPAGLGDLSDKNSARVSEARWPTTRNWAQCSERSSPSHRP